MNKKERLEAEKTTIEKKLMELRASCAEIKGGGSRYGDEYGEMQIKVYEQMLAEVIMELKKMKEVK